MNTGCTTYQLHDLSQLTSLFQTSSCLSVNGANSSLLPGMVVRMCLPQTRCSTSGSYHFPGEEAGQHQTHWSMRTGSYPFQEQARSRDSRVSPKSWQWGSGTWGSVSVPDFPSRTDNSSNPAPAPPLLSASRRSAKFSGLMGVLGACWRFPCHNLSPSRLRP